VTEHIPHEENDGKRIRDAFKQPVLVFLSNVFCFASAYLQQCARHRD
jgi:hypothetical protein